MTGGTLLSAFGAAYEQNATGLLQIVLVASFPDAVTNVYVAVLRVRGRLRAAAGPQSGDGHRNSWPVVGVSACRLASTQLDGPFSLCNSRVACS